MDRKNKTPAKKKSKINLEALQVDKFLTETDKIIEPKPAPIDAVEKKDNNEIMEDAPKKLTQISILDLEKKQKLLRMPIRYEEAIYEIQKEEGASKLSSSEFIIMAIREKLEKHGK